MWLNLYSSTFLLTIISVDRCVVVMFPVWAQNQRTVRRASVIVMVTWIISAVLGTPLLVVGNIHHNDNEQKAKCNYRFITNVIIFILGVAGNGLVIWIAGFKVKKSVITTWYLSLAVSDFIYCSTLPFGVVSMDYMQADYYNSCPEHHIRFAKDGNGVMPYYNEVTQNGSFAFVLVKTSTGSMCGGTLVRTMTNSLLLHATCPEGLGVGDIVHNCKEFVESPLFCHNLQSVQFESYNRPSLLDQFVQFVYCSFVDAVAPANNRIEYDTSNNRLVERPQEFSAHPKGPQFPQKVQTALSFLCGPASVFPVSSSDGRSGQQANSHLVPLDASSWGQEPHKKSST
ncbi:hypothetical protein NFI96_006040 [Prochilodus magdalenae]|nr:hypothetical protein NFI96_006040 [Prochilodus magdalenae]